jgi:hypothetical protein
MKAVRGVAALEHAVGSGPLAVMMKSVGRIDQHSAVLLDRSPAAPLDLLRGNPLTRERRRAARARTVGEPGPPGPVETRGIEPLTPALQRQCSAN